MIDKFPFDAVLPDLKILDPHVKEEMAYTHMVNLSSKFTPDVDQEGIKEEWQDFQMILGTTSVNPTFKT